MLSNNLEQRRNGIEAPYIPIPSTADELIAYFRNAGLNLEKPGQDALSAGSIDCVSQGLYDEPSALALSALSIMSEFSSTFFCKVGPMSSASVGTPKS